MNSSKSFSLTSLRFPLGAFGVMGCSSSIVADIEDVCGCRMNILLYTILRINVYILTISTPYLLCSFSRNVAIPVEIVASASLIEWTENV